MKRKRKRKLPRRKRQHWSTASAMNVDRRQAPERRVVKILGPFDPTQGKA